ncbi:cytochrome P450 [Streptomyces sp. NPDC059680]|uniref:cytochrome P450 family protein n=1 Tax=Streptomyces TaxID=1883 RepID=UPI001E385363|nr:cytochrome P450 [Streptomyces barringtoniae]MCC5480869.1 cytochrome P450 [Streptomyces barringtoniae]
MHKLPVPLVLDPSGQDLHGEAAVLRQLGPVAQVVLPGGVKAWSVNRLDLIKQVMTDPAVSKDAYQHWPAWISREVDDSWPLAMWVSVRSMLTAYGPDHTRLRKLIAGAFTTRRVTDLQPRIRAITDELLSRLERRPADQPVDLRREFAYELPLQVISEMLGLDDEERHDFHRVVNTLFTTSTTPEKAQQNQIELYGLLNNLVRRKRTEPAADLTSALIAMRDEDGGGLTEKELVDTLHLILGAGHETTINLLDHAICALLTHPEQLRLVREGAVTWEAVVDETLRCQAPVANIPLRFAIEDIELDGTVVPAGEPILLSLVAAGRDPGTHGPDADTFDVTRARREHVSFGHGVHHCLGRPLAMSEATIALPALFERFPHLRLAVPAHELRRSESFISSGHAELPVLLTPES